MADKKPSKREQRAIESAERLRALGIAAEASGDTVRTNVGVFTAPQREGALWHASDAEGWRATYFERHLTLEKAIRSEAKRAANRTSEAIKTFRERETAALKEAAEAKAGAERAERRLAAAEDVLAKILAVVGDAP